MPAGCWGANMGLRCVHFWLQLTLIQPRPGESARVRRPLLTCGYALQRMHLDPPGAIC